MSNETVQAIFAAADELAEEAEALVGLTALPCEVCCGVDINIDRLTRAARALRVAQLNHESVERARACQRDRDLAGLERARGMLGALNGEARASVAGVAGARAHSKGRA
jgi:hypothetical protein